MAEDREVEVTIDIELVIPLTAYRKIMAYTMLADSEVSGFADIEYNKETKKLVVGEVYLLEQTGSGAHTDMSEEVVSDFNLSLVKKGKTQMPRLWWHSHHKMGVFFSGTDDDTMEYLENDSFIVALVVNQKKEMFARFILNNPIHVEVDNLPIHVAVEYEEIPATLIKEVERKVNNPKKKEPIIIVGTPDTETEKKGSGSGIILPNGINDEGWDRRRKIFSSRKTLQFLPKSPVEAEERVRHLQLVMLWDMDMEQYVYKEPNGNVWVDYWNSLGTADIEEDRKNREAKDWVESKLGKKVGGN